MAMLWPFASAEWCGSIAILEESHLKMFWISFVIYRPSLGAFHVYFIGKYSAAETDEHKLDFGCYPGSLPECIMKSATHAPLHR